MNPTDFVLLVVYGFGFGAVVQIVALLARRGQP